MLTQEEMDLAAAETCQASSFVRLVALQLQEIVEEFTPADLIGQVTLAVEYLRETSKE